MKTARNIIQMIALVVLAAGLLAVPGIVSADCLRPPFTDTFMMGACEGFSSTGTNPYFVLKPGFKAVFKGKEEGEVVQLTITVLDETEKVDGIETRVVEERETVDGELAEVSKNYFAICNRNNSVFYFGEDVDIYNDDGTISHEGSWRAGVSGARAGIIMPGVILNGGRYYQEIAPGVAMDRAEIVSLKWTVKTPKGTFHNCLKTAETTPLEPGVTEYKFYAPGIGLIKDGVLELISYGYE